MAEPTTAKKNQILEAAAQLFRDKGYAATSMRDLAALVNLKASSLYNHISSKQDLLREICFNNALRFRQGMDEVEQRYQLPQEQVAALIQLHLRIAIEDKSSVTAFNDEWRHLEEPLLTAYKAERRAYRQRFTAILERGMATGVFVPLSSELVFRTLLSSMRWVYDRYRPGQEDDLKRTSEQICTLLTEGLVLSKLTGIDSEF